MQPADIYLIDEPSAYLDSEQRIVASKVIKRFILHAKKTAFVVEHDFIMATYLADRVIVYEGQPSIDCVANSPQSLLTGMNLFLSVSLASFWFLFLLNSLNLPSFLLAQETILLRYFVCTCSTWILRLGGTLLIFAQESTNWTRLRTESKNLQGPTIIWTIKMSVEEV